ncbi:MAG TPA: hypothetical protein VGR82_17635 [Methylomirabilota bacterium]|nr:hypothetical protein [Methylomirabilota bacterium]
MIDLVHARILPTALELLPREMTSPEAHALLLAIGLQESGFLERRQLDGGPARGFWQFERGGGTAGVLSHASARPEALRILRELHYEPAVASVHLALEHNDLLAAVFARLLLWTLPGRLPRRTEPWVAWGQYLKAWKPGAPRRATWAAYYRRAWELTDVATR